MGDQELEAGRQDPQQRLMELSPQLVAIITTEHYNLQSGRSMTISESVGRSSLFVGAVSSGLVALAFVGTIAHLGTAFFVFGVIVIPTLFFMGVVTFERVLQTGSQDIIYARGINRIRHLYLEYAPQMQPYFVLSADDDALEVRRHENMSTTWWQIFLSMAGMIALINSVLAGAFAGLLLALFAVSLWFCAVGGVLAFLVSVTLHQRYQWQTWKRNSDTFTSVSPQKSLLPAE